VPATELVIASYNVHRCIGYDRRQDAGRVAAVLAELDAHVVGLQEVDARPESEGGLDQLAYLARASGFAWVRGPTLRHAVGHTGNALLTRLRVRNARLLDLSLAGREPRGAIDVEIAHGPLRLRIVVTHLGLHPGERSRQCERLVEGLRPQEPVDVSVLLGDFNDWWAPARRLDALHGYFGRGHVVRSFPAVAPLLPLDRIWVKPASALAELRAHRSRLARRASDHLPIRAVLDVGPWLRRDATPELPRDREGESAKRL
jgi:endonuclease/exonuclease/phosphatase family metal-dependent hydrolase